jgi:hypothetical protein
MMDIGALIASLDAERIVIPLVACGVPRATLPPPSAPSAPVPRNTSRSRPTLS